MVPWAFESFSGRQFGLFCCMIFALQASWVLPWAEELSLSVHLVWLLVSCYRAEAAWAEPFPFWVLLSVFRGFFLVSERLSWGEFYRGLPVATTPSGTAFTPAQSAPNFPMAPGQVKKTVELPQPNHPGLTAPVISCCEKGEVPQWVLAPTEFPDSVGACQLPFSAKLCCQRNKQQGEDLTPPCLFSFYPYALLQSGILGEGVPGIFGFSLFWAVHKI